MESTESRKYFPMWEYTKRYTYISSSFGADYYGAESVYIVPASRPKKIVIAVVGPRNMDWHLLKHDGLYVRPNTLPSAAASIDMPPPVTPAQLCEMYRLWNLYAADSDTGVTT